MATSEIQVHPVYAEIAEDWALMRAVAAGQRQVKAAGERYLPGFVGMSSTATEGRAKRLYDIWVLYKQRAYFYAATQRTIEAFVGLLTRVEPTLVVPDAMDAFVKDVTQTGTSLEDFGAQSAEEQLVVSRGGVLVDFPQRQTGIRSIQELAEGRRPAWCFYKAEDILDWHYETRTDVLTSVDIGPMLHSTGPIEVRNVEKERRVLSFVLLREQGFRRSDVATTADSYTFYWELTLTRGAGSDDAAHAGVYQIRKLDENRVQIGEAIIPTLPGGEALQEIPFYTLGLQPGSEDVSYPVLLNLANANINHYQLYADYMYGLRMTALPTPWAAGVDTQARPDGSTAEEPIETLGPSIIHKFKDPSASLNFLEFEGKGMETFEAAFEEIKGIMASLGAEVIAPQRRVQRTATEEVIENTGRNSKLSRIGKATSSTLLSALKMTARWMNLDDKDIEYALPTDFLPKMVDARDLEAWIKAVQAGKMSNEEFFDLLKTGELIDRTKSFEDHQREIEESLPDGVDDGGDDEPVVLEDDDEEEEEEQAAPEPEVDE